MSIDDIIHMNFGVYHTYNRGVEKRKTFCEEQDLIRGVHDIYEFNDANIVTNVCYRFSNLKQKNYRHRMSIEYPISIESKERKIRKILVDLFAWILMPNHYHFLSAPRIKEGLAKFHQKFGMGYTKSFNLKYNRSGVLFQGKYKKILVNDDAGLAHLVCYLHSNFLDLWNPGWKERGLTSLELQNALKFLEKKENRWSSHQDYLGIKNFPSLINSTFLNEFFNGPEGYRNFFISWLKQYKKNIKSIKDIILE